MAGDHPETVAGAGRPGSATPEGERVMPAESLRDIVKPANLLRSARRHKFAFLTLIVGLTLAFYLVWRIAEHELTTPARIGLDDGPVIGIAVSGISRRDFVDSGAPHFSRTASLSVFDSVYPR